MLQYLMHCMKMGKERYCVNDLYCITIYLQSHTVYKSLNPNKCMLHQSQSATFSFKTLLKIFNHNLRNIFIFKASYEIICKIILSIALHLYMHFHIQYIKKFNSFLFKMVLHYVFTPYLFYPFFLQCTRNCKTMS